MYYRDVLYIIYYIYDVEMYDNISFGYSCDIMIMGESWI